MRGMPWALRTEGATMREIDLIPIRLHKGEPTWEIIDELIEHIDSLAGVTLEEFDGAVEGARSDGFENGFEDGFEVGYDEGYNDGYGTACWDGRADKAGND